MLAVSAAREIGGGSALSVCSGTVRQVRVLQESEGFWAMDEKERLIALLEGAPSAPDGSRNVETLAAYLLEHGESGGGLYRTLVREIYADAAAEVSKVRERIRWAAKSGDAELITICHEKLLERERAMRRIKAVCVRRGVDVENYREGAGHDAGGK